MQASREQAIAAIHGERDYQNQKWPHSPEYYPSPLEYLVFMEDYIREAKQFYSRNPDAVAREFALNAVRKVGAMAVACMEENGVFTRAEEGPRPVGYTQS